MLGLSSQENLLILTKTYPTPSTKHRETTCVAALTDSGKMRRIFPVPFRLLDGQLQFKRWEWVATTVKLTEKDHRPESRKIDVDNIKRMHKIGTQNGWQERLQWIEPHILPNYLSLEERRITTGETLGFIRPNQIAGLDITPVKDPIWTDADKKKLMQDGLFDSDEIRNRPPLRKMPHDFHYRYESNGQLYRHKITDWEIGALYWNCNKDYGSNWENKFRQKLEEEFPTKKDLIFLMGTVHRFPDQWLIIGVVYPPKQTPEIALQGTLF